MAAPSSKNPFIAPAAPSAGRWRVLFLDFDGVVHPFGKDPDGGPAAESLVLDLGVFCWLEHLERLVLPHPDVGVVVHSSWRYPHSDDELADMLGALNGRYLGKTPRGARYASITRWLKDNRSVVGEYLILDDATSEFPPSARRRLLPCISHKGLSDHPTQASLAQWLERTSNAGSSAA